MKKISDLIQDDRNANKGTARGNQVVEASLRKYGAGRSILIDKNGRIIAGNKTAANAAAAGVEDLLIVKSDGTKLIAVQRTDLDINDPATRELAIADNRSSELGLEWDPAILSASDLDLEPFFSDAELKNFTFTPAEAPSAFQEFDENIQTDHSCPKCGYKWSGGK